MSEQPSTPGRVAIVTGASAGIGAACAAVLAERGYNLVVMSRSDAIHAGAAIHLVGQRLFRCIASRPRVFAYRVERCGNQVADTPLPTIVLNRGGGV